MRVELNGESRDVPEGVSLERLVELYSLPRQRGAIELNREVVRRAEWAKTVVADNDRIEIIHFVGGG